MAVKSAQALKVDGLSFGYEKERPVVNDLSFAVEAGERVGIIGPNGAGKSTLLLLLNGILKPWQGTIEVLGLRSCEQNQEQIKQRIGLVFQNPEDQLFCPTVFEDVAFGPINFGLSRDEVKIRVSQALDEVGMTGFEERSTLNLSFGEKKLTAIATILSMKPQIVLLDEPTGNLDAIHRRKIIQWVAQNGRTCLITSHDLDMIYDTCERTVVLNRGRIVADGPTRRILQDRPLLEQNDLELPLRFQYH